MEVVPESTLADEVLAETVYFSGNLASLAGGVAVGIWQGKKAVKKHGKGWGVAIGIGCGLLTNLAGGIATIFASKLAADA